MLTNYRFYTYYTAKMYRYIYIYHSQSNCAFLFYMVINIYLLLFGIH